MGWWKRGGGRNEKRRESGNYGWYVKINKLIEKTLIWFFLNNFSLFYWFNVVHINEPFCLWIVHYQYLKALLITNEKTKLPKRRCWNTISEPDWHLIRCRYFSVSWKIGTHQMWATSLTTELEPWGGWMCMGCSNLLCMMGKMGYLQTGRLETKCF